MNNSRLVSVIIVNFNGRKLLEDCLKSLMNIDYKNYEVIVVDNVSTDGSHKKCKGEFEKIQLIENSENFGYCEGNNIGIRKAKGEFIVI